MFDLPGLVDFQGSSLVCENVEKLPHLNIEIAKINRVKFLKEYLLYYVVKQLSLLPNNANKLWVFSTGWIDFSY